VCARARACVCVCVFPFKCLFYQAGELSENSLISEIFVSISEKIMQIFLLNAYVFRDFLIFLLNFQRYFLHCVLHPVYFKLLKTVKEHSFFPAGSASVFRPSCCFALVNSSRGYYSVTGGQCQKPRLSFFKI
jgi:hypothetical protein